MADTGNQPVQAEKIQSHEPVIDAGSTGSDEVINISTAKKQKKKKTKSQKRKDAALREQQTGERKRRVVFKTENNVTREFHQHSKVATRALPNRKAPENLKSAIKKNRETK